MSPWTSLNSINQSRFSDYLQTHLGRERLSSTINILEEVFVQPKDSIF